MVPNLGRNDTEVGMTDEQIKENVCCKLVEV